MCGAPLTSSCTAMISKMNVAIVVMKPRKILPQLRPTIAELGTSKKYAPTYIRGVMAHLQTNQLIEHHSACHIHVHKQGHNPTTNTGTT